MTSPSIPRPLLSVPLTQRRAAAEWEALGVVCPSCHGRLGDATEALICPQCSATYRLTCGIPDLRTIGDPYLSIADDVNAAESLAARAEGRSFGELYASYYEGNAKVSPEQVARFTHGVLAAADRAGATVETWRDGGGALPANARVLDLGCGTAPLGVVLAAAGHQVIGVDAGLRWLVLARARAAAYGIDLPVICANAERLPLRDVSVRAVVGESVLENLTDAAAGIAEAHRVIQSGGMLALTTPNRHSVGPDPHLGLLAGGWRSPKALQAYARRTGQVMPRRRLFAPSELAKVMRDGGFRDVRVLLPRFTDTQRAGLSLAPNLAIAGYHVLRRIPVVGSVVMQIAPSLAVVARNE